MTVDGLLWGHLERLPKVYPHQLGFKIFCESRHPPTDPQLVIRLDCSVPILIG
jgi:hypothetical protein